ncbi:MAG: MmcQ/YjbR family DNA-binding protein [Acidobacteria bacterium]|nr:MmcQ/YjbR family DNA-binding protein [Acidobacteriota bacterium]
MDAEVLREYCLAFPHATESLQWGNHLVFKVGGKMFAILDLDNLGLSFPCSPDDFYTLTEQANIIPAPYSARYHWVLLQKLSALPSFELKEYLQQAYTRTFSKLPKKVQAQLTTTTEQ